jgi:probable DNA repair protein
LLELPKDLATDLDTRGTLVVLSAQRAAAVRLAHAAAQLGRGARLWPTPDVSALEAWLERETWRASESGTVALRPLRAAEEWLLWREATQAALRGEALETREILVQSLRRAARTLHEWHIPPQVLKRSGSPESELLARALEHFETRCAALGAVGSHRLTALLPAWRPRAPVTFAGFSHLTPARRELLGAWEGRGIRVREHREAGPPAATSLVGAADPSAELEQLATWCRAQLAADGSRRLLVVVPALAQQRAEVVRILEQTLTPEIVMGAPPERAVPSFAIEGGRPLSEFPLVRHALTTLRLLTGSLEASMLAGWLRAAFWARPTPAERARLDAQLSRAAAPLDAGALLAALERLPAELAAAASSVRVSLAAARQALEPEQPAAGLPLWCRRFVQALRLLGFPGTRLLSSAEQQARLRFTELLEECASLGAHVGAVGAERALAILEGLAGRAAFEPASGDPAVTVTAALTDPLVHYHGIWVTGLHADAWPAAPRIDAFVPLGAQRQAGVLAASAAGRLAEARTLLGRWQQAASELVLSWPLEEEGQRRSMSALLAELPEARRCEPAPLEDSLARRVRATRRIESLEDSAGPPWPLGTAVPAGTRVIDLQSTCAFRAHAELRLGAVPLESLGPGVDPRERGRLLHRALELLWGALEDSHGLSAAHAARRLEALIEECVQRAAGPLIESAVAGASAAAVRREVRRTARVMHELCELELARPPFRVRGLEARRSLRLADAQLEVRIDRIDELADGTSIIFDYKSGKPARLDWLSDRLTQPQLLVYERAAGVEVAALAAVHLLPRRLQYRGLADHSGRLPRLEVLSAEAGQGAGTGREEWHAQRERWRVALERLARDFLAGRAQLDPAAHACRTCHLHALCRIADAQAVAEDVAELPAESADD